MSANLFKTAEAWDVSTGMNIGEGNHVAKIDGIEHGDRTPGGHSKVIITWSNPQGTIRDFLTLDPVGGVAKVVALCEATGVDRPEDEDIEDDGSSVGKLKDAYLKKFTGKEAGIVVRNEPDFKDPTKEWARVQGYKPADLFRSSDTTPPGAIQEAAGTPASSKDEPKIPF